MCLLEMSELILGNAFGDIPETFSVIDITGLANFVTVGDIAAGDTAAGATGFCLEKSTLPRCLGIVGVTV